MLPDMLVWVGVVSAFLLQGLDVESGPRPDLVGCVVVVGVGCWLRARWDRRWCERWLGSGVCRELGIPAVLPRGRGGLLRIRGT